ncbi:MAG: hypothetical protein SOU07_01630 [Bacilli bacterium]|nr:hypothetical protein [Acholeplasmataceae bacterium]MDY2902129.1 hypothetical protein [Bacilli bacterium]
MDFSNLFTTQPQVVKLINNSFQSNHLVNTYLFYGEKGTLKMDAALYFASLVLCEAGGACGVCEQCKRIEQLTNPNIFIISPEQETIKKEQIDSLEHEFALSSDYKRVFIIKDIDKATLSASNSLLKFLESLNEGDYGILLSENINLVLPTIKSRSVLVHFLPKAKQLISKELINRGVIEDNSRAIATITNNSSEAMNMAKDKMFNQILDLVKKIGVDIEDESKNITLELVTEGNFLKQLEKKYHIYFLDLLINIQSDKVKKQLCMDNLVFSDTLEFCQLTLSRKQEVKILEIILNYKEKMKYNINIDLMYTSMLIEIGMVTR